MKKIWKWILGIVLVLVLIAAVGFAGHFFADHSHGDAMMSEAYGRGEWRMPMQDEHGPAVHFREPMRGGRGFFPYGGFFFLGGLLRLIIPIGVLALVIYLAYRAGKNAGMVAAGRKSEPQSTPQSELQSEPQNELPAAPAAESQAENEE